MRSILTNKTNQMVIATAFILAIAVFVFGGSSEETTNTDTVSVTSDPVTTNTVETNTENTVNAVNTVNTENTNEVSNNNATEETTTNSNSNNVE